MLAKLILSLIRVDFRNHYYHPLTLLSEIIAILGTLIIYWFSSKAFTLAVQSYLHQDYFSYLLIGDLVLSTPLYFIDTFVRKIRLSIHDKTFQTLLCLPLRIIHIMLTLGLSGLTRDILRTIITFALAVVFFNFHFEWLNLFKIILFQLLFIPPFLALGITISLLILYMGRGEGVLGYINTVGSFLAGAFFPIAVLPVWLQKSTQILSPITFLLEQSRQILHTGSPSLSLPAFIATLLTWYFILIPISLIAYKKIIFRLHKKGFQLLITG